MIIVMFTKLIAIYKKRYLYYNKFLLERYMYNFNYKKFKLISNKNNFHRDRYHYINYEKEKDYLKKIFDNY